MIVRLITPTYFDGGNKFQIEFLFEEIKQDNPWIPPHRYDALERALMLTGRAQLNEHTHLERVHVPEHGE